MEPVRLTPDLSRRELAQLLEWEDFGPVYREADRVRRERVGDDVHIRAILEFSNYCRRRCRYCGLNAANRALTRYRMEPDDIVDTAKEAVAKPFSSPFISSSSQLQGWPCQSMSKSQAVS